MAKTKREILTEVYVNYKKDISQISDTNLIPDNYDLEDLLFFFNMYFQCEANKIRPKIEELYEMQDINLDELDKELFIQVSTKYIEQIQNILNVI